MPVPGPAVFGRGVVVAGGAATPPPWASAPVVVISSDTLDDPSAAVGELHSAWATRRPVVVDLRIDPALFREPMSMTVVPWQLSPDAEPWFDRLHFLVWMNNYDARRPGEPAWWWGRKAARLDPGATPSECADVTLPDGRPAWIDGGPRQPWGTVDGAVVIHAESVDDGALTIVPPTADPIAGVLAPDQLAAVGHGAGPARVIAPAGSGKTRVLTERLRHLLRDRHYERESVLAVAYNKQAQLEMAARTTDVRPRVRTLNSLGLWVLTAHRGTTPPVVDEREVRRLIDALLPGRRVRRANTDPIGPYVEGLAAIRLGLIDPEEVEECRDDVPGLAVLFPEFRARLAERGAIDFDEQIYAAIEVLFADGPFRRRLQRTCRHLLVDEFQDLTPAHVLLVRLLALPALDVFGVGDDDQCIYGHAGADPAFLIGYRRLFPGAAEHALTVNYRCPVEVVSGARTLLGYNHRRVPKEINAGPHNDPSPGTLQVVEHGHDDGAGGMVAAVRAWLGEPDVQPASMAVLARVNSMLLAPHVALREAGVPINSVLHPDVLERTGMRAALAYLRIAAATGQPAARDIIEILRRPSRGLPRWFSERLARRRTWTLDQLARLADQVPDKDSYKVGALVEDLAAVAQAGRSGSTRHVLEVVRDEIGLGAAMNLLDRTGGGQGSSHLDDLEGLLGVADLHPEVGTFEPWVRSMLEHPDNPHGVTLSTIHRVKGREWDRVALFGVTDGIVPHRLAQDREEERRVLHVGITRGRRRVLVLADGTRPSSFLAELAGTAPRRQPRPVPEVASATSPAGAVAALRVPEPLSGAAAVAESALREWRARRARADGVPAYVVIHDRHLRGIAVARPSTLRHLIACDGIGPTKLERYGDEILAVLESLDASVPP